MTDPVQFRPLPTTPEGWRALAAEIEARAPQLNAALESLDRAGRVTQAMLQQEVTI